MINFIMNLLDLDDDNDDTTAVIDNSSNEKKKGEKQMTNFTTKETNLLFQTIITEELGIDLSDNIADLRSKHKIFRDGCNDEVTVKQFDNKQDTTRVRIFKVKYTDEYGNTKTSYTKSL